MTREMGAAAADAWSVEGLNLMEVAHIVTKLKMYPYFDIANYVLMCSMVREDSQAASSTSGLGAGMVLHGTLSGGWEGLHWRRLVKIMGGKNIRGKMVITESMGVSQLCGGRAQVDPKVYAYTNTSLK